MLTEDERATATDILKHILDFVTHNPGALRLKRDDILECLESLEDTSDDWKNA